MTHQPATDPCGRYPAMTVDGTTDTLALTLHRVAAPEPDVEALLARHAALMQAQSPAESCHVLSAEALRAGGAHVFALRDADGGLTAVGAYRIFGDSDVELKSMHVAEGLRGRGIGRVLLERLLDAARAEGHHQAWLETGSAPEFAAARALYSGAGFRVCAPFAAYRPDPLSLFMARML